MLRYTEEELHAYMARRVPSKAPDDAITEQTPRILGKDATSSPAITGSGTDAPAHSEKGGMVILPYPISANRYWRNFRGRMVVSSEAKAYKAMVIWSFDALGIIPTSKPVELSMKLHPKLTTKGKASRTLIDLDNCIKVCLDALQGVLYLNDKQVKKLYAEVASPVAGGGLSVAVAEIL